MLHTVTIFIILIAYPLTALTSEHEPNKDTAFSQNKKRSNSCCNCEYEFGQLLPKKCKNSDTIENDYFELADQIPFTNIVNIDILISEQPQLFINLLFKSIPKINADVNMNLEYLYRENFQINKLIDALPSFDTSYQKLAAIILELVIWSQVRAGVWVQVGSQNSEYVGGIAINQFGGEVWAKIGDYVWAQVGPQISEYVGDQVRDQVVDLMNEDLMGFDFSLAFQESYSGEEIIPRVNNIFMIYQLGSIAMKHFIEFKEIQNQLVNFISDRMTGEQVENILNGIEIPESHHNYLVVTQLKMIGRQLPHKQG